MFRLVLSLPFGVYLVHKRLFVTQQDAEQASDLLSLGFVVTDETNIDMKTVVLVPIKEAVKTLDA